MDLSKIDISQIPPEMLQKFMQGAKKKDPKNKPYKINDIEKMSYAKNSQEYILKIDSKDRNINREPNPFDMTVRFNRNSDVDATINSKFENIKFIDITGISVPKKIPASYPGKKFNKIFAVCNGTDKVIKFVPLPGVTVKTKSKTVSGVTVPYIHMRHNNTNIYVVSAAHKSAAEEEIDGTLICAFYQDNQVISVSSVSNNSITFTNTIGQINEHAIAADFETINADNNAPIADIEIGSSSFTINNIYNVYTRVFPNSVLYITLKDGSGGSSKAFFYITSVNKDANKTYLKGNYSSTLDTTGKTTYTVKLFTAGYRDLLQEKYFIISIKQLQDDKETGTNDACKNSYATVLPLKASNDNLILTGHAHKIYTYRNLKNLNQVLNLQILDSDGNIIGKDIFNNVHDDLKKTRCYQIFYNIKLKEVDRHLI
jgi:hypothetical protein